MKKSYVIRTSLIVSVCNGKIIMDKSILNEKTGDTMIRLGIIGTGFIAHPNYEALRDSGEVQTVALCNRTVQKAQDFAAQYGLDVPVFSDYREMVDQVKPDAVLINTPHDLHEEQFIYCAERGIHVLIEKPLAIQSDAGRRMADCAEKNGIKAAICHTQRYNSVFIAARKFIDSHDLGKLISINDVMHLHYFWDGRPDWAMDPVRSGRGIVMNYGVHHLDRVSYMAGKRIQKIFAHIDQEKPGVAIDSGYHAMGIMEDGVSFAVLCAGYSGPFGNRMELIFEKGIVRCVLKSNGCDTFGLYFGDTQTGDFVPVDCPDENDGMYRRQFKEMVDLLQGRENSAIPLEYGIYTVQATEALMRSADTGEAVTL